MDSSDITRENPQDGWYRRKIGRRIELGMNRLIGSVLAIAGLIAAGLTLANGIALRHDWFGLLVAAVLLLLARLCFKSKRGIVEGFGEEPAGTEPAPWKRRT